MSELSPEMKAFTERKTYDSAIIGPQLDDGAGFVLIAYDKAGPFGPGATHYSVDNLEVDEQTKERYAYRDGNLVLQFPKDIMYIMVGRSIVNLLDQEERKKFAQQATPAVFAATDADKSNDEGYNKAAYI